MEENETNTNELERRAFLQRAAAVAAVAAWAPPTVQSLMSPAFATGTGRCPPGRLVRFKYDVDSGMFDTGSSLGTGCLPDGYDTADITVNSSGQFTIDGVVKQITVTISADGFTAQVTIPAGSQIEDLQAKGGNTNPSNPGKIGECDDFDSLSGSTATVTLEEKEISFVAGVLCV